jgi:hypothetical protein
VTTSEHCYTVRMVDEPEDFQDALRKKQAELQAKRYAETDPEGRFIYTESAPVMTVTEGLAFAENIVEKFFDPALRIAAYKKDAESETRKPARPEDESRATEEMLEEQRRVFDASTKVDGILKIFDREKQDPGYYGGFRLLAAAEELLRRFPSK